MRPENEGQLAEIIGGAKNPLRVQGSGTRGIEGHGDLLKTRSMSGISLYEPGALTLVAASGTPMREIEETVASEGQRLAFEPMNHCGVTGKAGDPTIGGCVAMNVSGPRRITVGACRDALLGVRFVDGAGRTIKNGGRVMKNVTGYDLVKLMAGSYGTLGVLSEVSLKVLPTPETSAQIVLHGLDYANAVSAMSKALGSPFEVSGAAHIAGESQTILRIEGFEEQVTYRATALQDLLAEFGEISVRRDQHTVDRTWANIRDVQPFYKGAGNVWRFSVRPSTGAKLASDLEANGADTLMDWGGGLIWALADPSFDARSLKFSGTCQLVCGSGFDRFDPEPAAIAALTKGLREKFDPKGILNPGVMG